MISGPHCRSAHKVRSAATHSTRDGIIGHQTSGKRPTIPGTATILLVYPDATVVRLLADVLSDAGYRVLIAKDGVRALTAFALAKAALAQPLMDTAPEQPD